jgi:hypothetical protein
MFQTNNCHQEAICVHAAYTILPRMNGVLAAIIINTVKYCMLRVLE